MAFFIYTSVLSGFSAKHFTITILCSVHEQLARFIQYKVWAGQADDLNLIPGEGTFFSL
jgi:hypothetical protein